VLAFLPTGYCPDLFRANLMRQPSNYSLIYQQIKSFQVKNIKRPPAQLNRGPFFCIACTPEETKIKQCFLKLSL
jgi:hypothetical protein